MKYLPAIAVLLLMLSTANEPGSVGVHRQLAAADSADLGEATAGHFIIPAALVLLLGKILPIAPAAMGRLYLIAWRRARRC